MLFLRACACFLFIFRIHLSVSLAKEPICSKFAYDEQLLEKMIRQEIKVEMMQNDIKKTQEAVSDTLDKIEKTGKEVLQTLAYLQQNFTVLEEGFNRDKERNEDILGNLSEELRNNLTNDAEEKRKMLTGLVENLKMPVVAFFAHNVVDLKLDKTEKIIVFDTATTNEGSGYDTSTGIFTAPVGGLYQFIVNYCTHIGQHSPLALVLSGNVIAWSYNYEKDQYTCSSFSAVIRVKSGEIGWVRSVYGGSSYSLYQDSWRMNSFSGILINM